MAEHALTSLDRIHDDRERRKAKFECQLLRGAVFTLLKGGGAEETAEAYERVAHLHRHDDEPDMHFQRHWGEWVVAFNTQPHSQALRVAENLLVHAEQHDSDVVLGTAQYAIDHTRLFMGDAACAERWLYIALQTLGKRGIVHPSMSTWGLERADATRGMLAWVLALQGRDNEGLNAPVKPGQLPSRALCHLVLAEVHRLRGDVENTQAAARRGDPRGVHAMEYAVKVAGRAMPIWQAPLELLLADSYSTLGEAELALQGVERAGALIEHYGTQLIRGAYLYQKGMALVGRGEAELAATHWQQAIVESRRLGLSRYAQRAELLLNTDAPS